jgi:hypothetical protein
MLIKIMEKIKEWVRKKVAMVSLSFANVEKNAFGQMGEQLDNNVSQVQRHTQGQLADSLVHGEVTQEVIDLRWRTYKILQHVDNMTDKSAELANVKTEPSDDYPLEMVVNNETITLGANELLSKNLINSEKIEKTKNDDGENIALHGSVDSTIFFALDKGHSPINIGRLFLPKFNIENFTKTLHVRKMNGDERLLEFYVSKYPIEENKNSNMFVREVKKCMNNPIASNMLEILEVDFLTFNTLGQNDNLMFKYEITSFYKIVEFNGYYVIKFYAKEIIGGENILEKHKSESLEERYKNKEKKFN